MTQISVIPDGVNRPDGMFTAAALRQHYAAVSARLRHAPSRPAPETPPEKSLRKPDPLIVMLTPPPPPPPVKRPQFIRNGWMFRARGIIEHVAAAHGLEYADLVSDRRFAKLVRLRQLAMYLCHEMLSLSLSEIGRRFGGKDHTTVLHAIRCIRKRLTIDANFAARVSLLRAEISVHMIALGIANDNSFGSGETAGDVRLPDNPLVGGPHT